MVRNGVIWVFFLFAGWALMNTRSGTSGVDGKASSPYQEALAARKANVGKVLYRASDGEKIGTINQVVLSPDASNPPQPSELVYLAGQYLTPVPCDSTDYRIADQ